MSVDWRIRDIYLYDTVLTLHKTISRAGRVEGKLPPAAIKSILTRDFGSGV
jgi:hypothetical protein